MFTLFTSNQNDELSLTLTKALLLPKLYHMWDSGCESQSPVKNQAFLKMALDTRKTLPVTLIQAVITFLITNNLDINTISIAAGLK